MTLTRMAASGTNDRCLDHASIFARNAPDMASFRAWCRQMGTCRPSALAAIYENRRIPVARRLIAGLALGGVLDSSKREDTPHTRKNLALYSTIIAAMPLPSIIKYIAAKGAELNVSSHPYMLPVVWQAATTEPVGILETELKASPCIAGLPSFVYDMHVPEGREAIAAFANECVELRELQLCYPLADWNRLIGITLFHREGGDVLQESLEYPTQRILRKAAQAAHLASAGLRDPQHQLDLADIVLRNMGLLDAIRRRTTSSCESPMHL